MIVSLQSMATAAVFLMMAAGICGAVENVPAERTAVTFELGDMQLTSLLDATDALDNDGTVFGISVGPQAVAKLLQQAGVPTNKITLSINVLLARSTDRVMLFDTGFGPAGHGALEQRLAALGVLPSEVTDIFITHAHHDHVGGLTTQQGRLAFINARIHISELEWTILRSRKADKALADLISLRVETFKPATEVIPGVLAVSLPGHTPGHTGFEIDSDGHKLIDVGDIVHSSIISLAEPNWPMGFDENKSQAIETRTSELERLAKSHELIFAPHFPFPGVGRIKFSGDGFRWEPAVVQFESLK
jgi:glyoxylase-like metal-dependent hydrolase (beta-lactamase superfamily II)